MKTKPRDPRLLDASASRVGRDRERAQSTSSLREQMTGMFLAPATFFAHLQLAYVLVPWSCARDNHLVLHLVGFLSVVLAAAGAFVAWRAWSAEGRDEPGELGGPHPRARMLGVVGAVMSAFFTLLLLAQWVAAFFLSPCQ